MDKDGLTDDKWRGDWSKDAEEGRELLSKRELPDDVALVDCEEQPRMKLINKPFEFER